MLQPIISNYKSGSAAKYQQNWKKAFKENSKRLELKIIRTISHNGVWAEKITAELKPSITESNISSTDTSTSSFQYQKVLTEEDKTLMKHTHDRISGKWYLKEGVIVEDVMYNEAKDYSFEHPLHSYILHINDSNFLK
ncbi:hypothetical protein G6F70_008277 [Rhizopus microsporus]|uniref:Uncharacterized protein n=2 Tax=Rhizopus TaxID=4842 RepID=A0A367IQN4_RHIAZ|nr:hypothetical protein G6F71_008460 [Rhizopus microsporus]RCH79956.1 hypothetical protein CU097_003111 [Rhizopus azygosporus]KAG1195380.1 hypothetical protein G6F70_008277 [Rhizopus microsporus]KAG1206954.1 hypothetical protein G6F69_008435 [Rhizopus microsporus]KAG1227538.1 hypothetical protein G6F67_008388 [Rhizopus microsporus]